MFGGIDSEGGRSWKHDYAVSHRQDIRGRGGVRLAYPGMGNTGSGRRKRGVPVLPLGCDFRRAANGVGQHHAGGRENHGAEVFADELAGVLQLRDVLREGTGE